MADFKYSRMPSPDGNGRAIDAFANTWAKFAKALEQTSKSITSRIARESTFRIYGFWVVWYLIGGFEGLQKPCRDSKLQISCHL